MLYYISIIVPRINIIWKVRNNALKSANKVKMRTSIIVLFFIIVAAFCKYAYLLSDVMLFDKFAVFVRVFIYIGLFCAWAVSINKRILHSQVRKTLVTVAVIMIFWLTVREFKWRLVIDLTALRYRGIHTIFRLC